MAKFGEILSSLAPRRGQTSDEGPLGQLIQNSMGGVLAQIIRNSRRGYKNPDGGATGRASVGMDETTMRRGGKVKAKPKKMAKGGSVSSASKRADGIARKGKTRGKVC